MLNKLSIDKVYETQDGHRLAIYTKGNPEKPAVICLHGGPGGNIQPSSFDIFNLDEWFVIAFDQRGCGQSTPFATLENNTIFHSVEDIEGIRKLYNLQEVTLSGGSYGTTLAVAYAIKYPEHVSQMVLRGIFLGRDEDTAWLYQEGASYFYPEVHERFKANFTNEQKDNLIQSYYHVFKTESEDVVKRYAKQWADWEGAIVKLVPEQEIEVEITPTDISIGLLECHYFANHMFFESDNYILENVEKYKNIPTIIVHGRYDVDCRPSGAFELKQNMSQCELYFAPTSGHSGSEPEIKQFLIKSFDNLVSERKA